MDPPLRLALAKSLMLLRNRGVEVHFYEASEINKGEGGPTCLTRPIKRG